MRKFMGKQDRLAVVAASLAVGQAALSGPNLRDAGVFLTVGYIPFERQDIDVLTRSSLDEQGRFSMDRFSEIAIKRVNPLLTFRVLPNMPIFHVSLNLGIQGRYFINYPGPGQFYTGLSRAEAALRRGEIQVALVGGVADQQNFLVRHHFSRLPKQRPDERPEGRLDVASFLVLERADFAATRGARAVLKLLKQNCEYSPPASPSGSRMVWEKVEIKGKGERLPGEAEDSISSLGPASLPVALARAVEGRGQVLTHSLATRDGIRAGSLWGIL
jgi:3-oxoacyl-(acyl-carrier-protein) synthase